MDFSLYDNHTIKRFADSEQKTDIFNDRYKKRDVDEKFQSKKFEANYVKGTLKTNISTKGVRFL